MNSITERQVKAYLFCGYGRFNESAITEVQPVDFASSIARQTQRSSSLNDLMTAFQQCFTKSIKQYLEVYPSAQHILPLSGGLDSRLILTYLLKFLPAGEISTFTFGVPGSLDYEIGNAVARSAGTRHFAMDLSESENLQKIIESQSYSLGFTNLNNLPPISLLSDEFDLNSALYWSGFMGDPLFGSHWPVASSGSFRQDIIAKEENGMNFQEDFEFRQECMSAFSSEFSVDNVQTAHESEYWDLEYRQKFFVTPQIFFKKINYATPFISPATLEFANELSVEDIYKSYFYHSFLRHCGPLFTLPTKTYLGSPIPGSLLPMLAFDVRRFVYGRSLRLRKKKLANYYVDLNFHKEKLRGCYLDSLELLIEKNWSFSEKFKNAYLKYDSDFNINPQFYGLCWGLSHGILNG